MNTIKNPAEIATIYTNFLKAFLKRADVQDGKRISYHDNQDPDGPLKDENWVNLGYARVTTGFCVSFSFAILKDELFQILLQSRNAQAKLVSIDIKEQYYGYCKPSYVQNKWHTGILVRDSGINFILDPTCAQFGNSFVGKFVWDFETWIKTFRHPDDEHKITDFNNNEITVSQVKTNDRISIYEREMFKLTDKLHNITTITDKERKILADFFLKGITNLNNKIELGNLTNLDFKYIDDIMRISKNMDLVYSNDTQYFVMSFYNKDSAKRWIKNFTIDNNCILPNFIILSKSILDCCKYYNFNFSNINIESTKEKTYVVLRFSSCTGFNTENIIDNTSLFIPYGIKCKVNTFFNGGKELAESAYGIEKKTNTIFVDLSTI